MPPKRKKASKKEPKKVVELSPEPIETRSRSRAPLKTPLSPKKTHSNKGKQKAQHQEKAHPHIPSSGHEKDKHLEQTQKKHDEHKHEKHGVQHEQPQQHVPAPREQPKAPEAQIAQDGQKQVQEPEQTEVRHLAQKNEEVPHEERARPRTVMEVERTQMTIQSAPLTTNIEGEEGQSDQQIEGDVTRKRVVREIFQVVTIRTGEIRHQNAPVQQKEAIHGESENKGEVRVPSSERQKADDTQKPESHQAEAEFREAEAHHKA